MAPSSTFAGCPRPAGSARRRVRAVALGLALVATAGASSAQSKPAPSGALATSSVVPPVPRGPLGVVYPDGAHGDASVAVEVVIDTAGHVVEATALDGAEPFRAAAESSAREWTFEPAMRNDAPVAARIRVAVSFHEPAAESPRSSLDTSNEGASGAARAPGAGTSARAGSTAEPESVVTIVGARAGGAPLEIRRDEARLIPGAFGDPLRAVEIMPGVVPMVSGMPYFFLRGAGPGEVGYFVDGIRLPALFHVGLGPSVIPGAMLEDVRLYPGGYPAQYGRYVGGIVATSIAPPSEKARGEASVGLADARAFTETPFAGGRASVIAGGRYGYAGAILSLFAPDVALDYWDYQTGVSYRPSDADTVRLLAFGAKDHLGTRSDGATLADSQFHRVNLRWAHVYDGGVIRQDLTLGRDVSRWSSLDGTEIFDGSKGPSYGIRSSSAALRTSVTQKLSRDDAVELGADVLVDRAERTERGTTFAGDDETGPITASLFPDRTDLMAGAWVAVAYHPAPGVSVTPGARGDLYSSLGATALSADARLATRAQVAPRLAIVDSLGTAHQPPAFPGTLPGTQIAGLRGGLQSSVQHAAGVELDVGSDTSVRATGFQNAMFGMSDALGNHSADVRGLVSRLDARAVGSSYGFELYVHRPLTKRVGGFVSYTLSQSTRTLAGDTFPAAFDRTHVLQGALSVDLGRSWRTGARGVFYTGVPFTPDVDPAQCPRVERTAPFTRLDTRVEKRWSLGGSGWMALVFEVQNATLSKEQINEGSAGDPCHPKAFGPMTIPSLALEAGY